MLPSNYADADLIPAGSSGFDENHNKWPIIKGCQSQEHPFNNQIKLFECLKAISKTRRGRFEIESKVAPKPT